MAFQPVALPVLDAILGAHARALGGDFTAYRHHCHRVANFHWRLLPGDGDALAQLSIAVAFHDLGIWTARTFNYLPPSMALAGAWLDAHGLPHWRATIAAMIDTHHKITPAPGLPQVEAFRRADWIDVSRGLLRFGLPRAEVREVMARFPNAGFHRRLLQLGLHRLRRHPFDPLPMMR